MIDGFEVDHKGLFDWGDILDRKVLGTIQKNEVILTKTSTVVDGNEFVFYKQREHAIRSKVSF